MKVFVLKKEIALKIILDDFLLYKLEKLS